MKTTYFLQKHKRKFTNLVLMAMVVFFMNRASAQGLNVNINFSDSARALGILQGNLYLSGIDSLNTTLIELTISTEDSTAINEVIEFDNPGSLPAGFTYERNGTKLTIGFTGTEIASTYYCSVRVHDNNSWGTPIKFIAN